MKWKTIYPKALRMRIVLCITILLGLPCLQSLTLAQEQSTYNPKVQSGDSVKFEAIPFDPVLDMLGYNNNQISQPGTIDKVLASASSAIDIRGRFQTGFAVSFAPYFILNAKNLYLRDYILNPATRILTNTQVSFGTAPSLNKDSSLNWGFGIKIPLCNTGDARIDTVKINYLVNLSEQIFAITKEFISPDIQRLVSDSNHPKMKTRLQKNIKSYENSLLDPAPDSTRQKTLQTMIDTVQAIKKDFIKAWQEKVLADTTLKNSQQKDSTHIDTLFKNIQDAITLHQELRGIYEQQTIIKSQTPSWNAPFYADFNAGIVYRASGANIKESGAERFRLWLNGGGQIFPFAPWLQVMGQVGYQHIFALGSEAQQRKDSVVAHAAVMLRGGNEDLRFGIGGSVRYEQPQQMMSSESAVKGLFMANLEVRYHHLWIIGSLSGQNVMNQADKTTTFVVTPNIGIKSTLGY
jgi:hypothetical protein